MIEEHMLLNNVDAYQLLTGEKNLHPHIVKSRLTYLRRAHGLKGVRVGRDFYYSRKQLKEFIQKKENFNNLIKEG